MRPRALLAIRSDIAPAVESEYLDWMTKEHSIERVDIDGFVSARIFRCNRVDIRRYLILYELEDAAVVDSPAYLERLNTPTPWSARMMPHLGNFIRGGGQVVANSGAGYGAALVAILIPATSGAVESSNYDALSKISGVVALRLLQTDPDRTSVATNERAMRTGDQTFDKLLLIEALDAEAAFRATQQLQSNLLAFYQENGAREDPFYSLVFYLDR